jgi:hypothetical protein
LYFCFLFIILEVKLPGIEALANGAVTSAGLVLEEEPVFLSMVTTIPEPCLDLLRLPVWF